MFKHLKPQAGTRIVTVSSLQAHQAKMNFDDLQSEREYKPFGSTQARSKLADLIFAIELQRRLSAIGSPIFSVVSHPGVTPSKTAMSTATGLNKILGPIVMSLIGQSAAQSALATLFAATSPDVEPGRYYGPDGFQGFKGYPVPVKIPAVATDKAVAARLWAETEKLTGVRFELNSGIG